MTTAEDLAELNRDIWHPFVRSYAALDADTFTGLYAPSLARGGSSSAGYEEYLAECRDFFAKAAEQGDSFAIEFRFTERLAAGGMATEQGVFKLSIAPAAGGTREQYGRFQVLSRRGDDETWQIMADYDDPAGSPESFTAGHPIDDLAAFLSGS